MTKKAFLFCSYINYTIFALAFTGCSVARLSRLLWEQEAAGSNPATPTKENSEMSSPFLFSEI